MNIQQDYFTFFGLDQDYSVDQAELSRRYRELQKQLHPDRFAHRSEQEKRLSVQYTAYLNEAFTCLKSPLARAQHLLKLRGFESDEHVSANLPAAFLMEQMHLREQLDDIRHSQTGQSASLQVLAEQVEQTLASSEQALAEYFMNPGDPDQALTHIRKLQFMTKLADEIEQAQRALH